MTRRQRWYRVRNTVRDIIAMVVAVAACVVVVMVIIRANAMLSETPVLQSYMITIYKGPK
jgi:hypothetical protein